MQTTSDRDSLDWPLVCASAAIAVMSRLALSNGLFVVSLMLLVSVAGATIWLAIRFFSAVKSVRLLRATSSLIAIVFMYLSAQWILPGRTAVQHANENFQFEGKRANYEALVKNRKLVDPRRTFILFKGREERQPGEVDQRVAYDETDTLVRGVPGQVELLVAQQSPDDTVEFASCRWNARHIDGHYCAVDFSC